MSDQTSVWNTHRNVIGITVLLGGSVLAVLLYFVVPFWMVDAMHQAIYGSSDAGVNWIVDVCPRPRPHPIDSVNDFCESRRNLLAQTSIIVAIASVIGGAAILAWPKTPKVDSNQGDPAEASIPAPETQIDHTSIEARLAKLDDLKSKGVITDDEHATRRAAILEEL